MTSTFLQRTESQMSGKSEDKGPVETSSNKAGDGAINRRNILLGTSTLVAAATLTSGALAQAQKATPSAPAPTAPSGSKPNIVIIWGDDIGQSDISAYSHGLMGFKTPNIDRIANEGMMFTDYYAEQSCTAGRASFITGQSGLRTGMTKVGLPGASLGLQKEDPTIAEMLKPLGYSTGQFGKKPSWRSERVPADGAWFRRVLRQPLPPECGGRARTAGLSEEPRIPGEVWTARGVGLQGVGKG
jgi:hypothetical protein